MTLTKLFAEVLFGVPRVLHFAIYATNYQIVAGQGESRPDLIGLSNDGDWYVFLRPKDVQTDSMLRLWQLPRSRRNKSYPSTILPLSAASLAKHISPRVVSASGWMIPRRSETIDLEQSRLADLTLCMPTTIPFAG
jgi:hypothetical protein